MTLSRATQLVTLKGESSIVKQYDLDLIANNANINDMHDKSHANDILHWKRPFFLKNLDSTTFEAKMSYHAKYNTWII